MMQKGEIRKVSYVQITRDGGYQAYINTKNQIVHVGKGEFKISEILFDLKNKQLSVIVANNDIEFTWFDLINPINLKIEFDYDFYKPRNDIQNSCKS